jgi:hypothetical protein
LTLLNEARNGIAHDDNAKLDRLRSLGWSPTVATARRWRGGLDGLTTGWTLAGGDMAARFKLGSRVVVPFGFHEVEGTVVRVSEVGTHLWVTVAIDSRARSSGRPPPPEAVM